MNARRIPLRSRRVETIPFPVTPMLDMAFQLLAFFILTFQPPSRETRVDLDLPATAAALPVAESTETSVVPSTDVDILETDLTIDAQSESDGDLRSLRLGGTDVPSVEVLEDRLRRYRALLEGRPLRIRVNADARLHYGEAARILGACSAAGAASIRLPDPGPGPT
jgi:biopolymer transport protein ExbD